METGKPLLVIGGPLGCLPSIHQFFIPLHGCGDVCYDINPKACGDCSVSIEGDIRNLPYRNGFFGAVFVSHVLEHLRTIEDLEIAISEMGRVADNIVMQIPVEFGKTLHMPGHRLNLGFVNGGIEAEEIYTGRMKFISVDGLRAF